MFFVERFRISYKVKEVAKKYEEEVSEVENLSKWSPAAPLKIYQQGAKN